jgi:4-hydroxybenzoyl-CoA thioesterase
MHLSRRERDVEWGDCDPAGIVFNPRFFEWFDAATAGIFSSAGVPKAELLTRFNCAGIPLVETRARFLAPSKFGDHVVIESVIAEFGRSSFKVEHKLFNKGALAVEGFETRVWTGRDPADPGKLKSQPIPLELIALLKDASA